MSKQISKSELQSLFKNEQATQKLTLLDVRDPSEFTSTELPPIHLTAKNVPVATVKSVFELENGEFEKSVGIEKPSTDDQIVCYCKLGGRAQKAADALVELGFTNVYCYKGSASEWHSN